MKLRFVWALTVCLGLAASAWGQGQPPASLIDVITVKVRPEKIMEYEAAIRKLADANLKHNGDHWLALSTEYGDWYTLSFVSPRANMAAVESAGEAMNKAMKEAYGEAGMMKVFGSLNAATASARSEIRRRRPDLGVNMPADLEGIYNIVGRSRWIRVVRIDLKPGKTAEFIEGWKSFKAELEKAAPELTFFVSQAMTGTPAIVVAIYAKSLGDFDAIDAQIRKAAESEAYTGFQRTVADAVDESRWEIQRLRPDLSNVPDEVAKVDPAFWHPKPPAAAKPAKPKEAAK